MAGKTRQRRKIFPHMGDEKSSSSPGAAPSGNDKAKTTDGGDPSYDNAKSSKPRRRSSKGKGKENKSGGGGGSNGVAKTRGAAPAPSDHLLPLPLVVTVLLCSGLFWMSSFRDVMATGKPVLDTVGKLLGQEDADLNLLQYTKSTDWFDDTKGWRSKQGGLSTISAVTTDANNMGGLFVRKLTGAAGLAYHTTKIWPVIFQSSPTLDAKRMRFRGSSWGGGHYDGLLLLTAFGNVCLAAFYGSRLDELRDADAAGLAAAYAVASLLEAAVFVSYVASRRLGSGERGDETRPAAGGSQLDGPRSLPSRIVARTVLIVSSAIALVAGRDLFLPGRIITFVPRDDIYLEWTGAFLHSPPPDTVESDEHGMEAPLFAGDKLVAQLCALYLLLCCLLKFASALFWSRGGRRMGSSGSFQSVDRGGYVASRMIWKAQGFGNMMVLGILRLFAPAAGSASLDLRWHLMLVAYEMLILLLYGFW